MVRFLIICITFFLLYLGFLILNQLDSQLSFMVYDYVIETTFFTIIAFFIIVVFLVLIISRIIFLIFDLPSIIRKKLDEKRIQKINNLLIQSMAKLLIGNRLKVAELAKTLGPNIPNENKELFYLVLAECEEDTEQKIQYLKELLTSKIFVYFALKRLAQIFHERKLHQHAEDYATKAFNLNESDSDILEILIHCYANFSSWSKFILVVAKLNKTDPEKLSKLKDKIADYYLLAAKNSLQLGKDNDSINYLQSAFEFNPTNIEALDLYLALNINIHHQDNNLEILKSAFTINPCFEIVELYFRGSNLPGVRIYEELAALVDPKQHLSLFLAIAAYLNLPEKIMQLKEQKLLPIYKN